MENIKKQKKKINRGIILWRNTFFVLLVLSAILSILFFAIYQIMRNDDYSKYTEKGCASYEVVLHGDYNPYGDKVPTSNMQYLSSKLKGINANLYYKLNMQKSDVEYKYTYRLKEIAEVVSVETGKTIISYENEITRQTKDSVKGHELTISESHYLDYDYHDTVITEFINQQSDLRSHKVTSTLKLVLEIELRGVCQDFEEDMSKFPSVYVSVPLATDTVSILTGNNITKGEGEIVMCKNLGFDFPYLVSACAFAIDTVVMLILWLVFKNLSLTQDAKYTKTVNKIKLSYGSYIQTISQPISTNYEQIVEVGKFTDLLDVSNIIKQPVLIEKQTDLETVYVVPESSTRIYMFRLNKLDFINKTDETQSAMTEAVTSDEVETLVKTDDLIKSQKRSKVNNLKKSNRESETTTEISVAEEKEQIKNEENSTEKQEELDIVKEENVNESTVEDITDESVVIQKKTVEELLDDSANATIVKTGTKNKNKKASSQQSTAKKKAGRPKKVTTTTSETIIIKKGPGRPKRVVNVTTVKKTTRGGSSSKKKD